MSDDQSKSRKRPRTRFEPVKRPESPEPPMPSASPPPEQPAPRQPAAAQQAAHPPVAPPPTLQILEPGQAPRYTGLARDERGIVVGDQALVAIVGRQRQAAFLAALSRVLDLAGGIQVEEHPVGDAPDQRTLHLVALTPTGQDTPRSLLYDTIQGALTAARLSSSRARLFVGDGRVFVPYQEAAAPHGYDVRGNPPQTGRVLLAPQGTRMLPDPQPASLLDTLLTVPLQPVSQVPPATTLTLLTDRRLAPLVAGYVQRHGLAYAVRFLAWQRADRTRQAALFDIVTASTVRPIPNFVSDFLGRLPATTLLTDLLESADLEHEPARRVLVPRGRRTPLYLPHTAGLLPAGGLLIMSERPWGTMLISPPPPRQTMQQVTEVRLAAPARVTVGDQPSDRLQLQMALVPAGPVRGPIHALLLDAQALQRLQRMVRHLPAPLFQRARIALGDGIAVVIAVNPEDEIERLPFGQPLVRSEPPELLLPRGRHLRPALPVDLLVPTLDLQPDTFTVLTPGRRYDIPAAALQPLNHLLTLEAATATVPISVRPVALPPLDLSDLEERLPVSAPTPQPEPTPPPPAQPPEPEREQGGLLERLLRQKPSGAASPATFEAELRQRADERRQAGDYLTAAIFYDYLNDRQNAQACFQHLVHSESA